MEEKRTMDFVEWCDLVLRKMIEANSASADARSRNVHEQQIGQALFGQFAMQPEFYGSKQREGMYHALRSLQQISLLEISQPSSWKLTKDARDVVSENDMTHLWQQIGQEKLRKE